jgi:hypothetical protein
MKVGEVFLELPATIAPAQQVKAEKPEAPEALEEQPYIYRPNDPFQSAVDEARAIASIGPSQKPWVKKTWFVLFVYGPLVYAEIQVLMIALSMAEGSRLERFLLLNAVFLPVWLVYRNICKKRVN